VSPVDVAGAGARCEVVDHEHRVGGREGEGLEGIRRGGPGPGQVPSVEAGAEVALDEGGQLALARPRGAGEVQGEVAGTEHGPEHRRQQGEGDRLRGQLQQPEARPHGGCQLVAGGRGRQRHERQGLRQGHLERRGWHPLARSLRRRAGRHGAVVFNIKGPSCLMREHAALAEAVKR